MTTQEKIKKRRKNASSPFTFEVIYFLGGCEFTFSGYLHSTSKRSQFRIRQITVTDLRPETESLIEYVFRSSVLTEYVRIDEAFHICACFLQERSIPF